MGEDGSSPMPEREVVCPDYSFINYQSTGPASQLNGPFVEFHNKPGNPWQLNSPTRSPTNHIALRTKTSQ